MTNISNITFTQMTDDESLLFNAIGSTSAKPFESYSLLLRIDDLNALKSMNGVKVNCEIPEPSGDYLVTIRVLGEVLLDLLKKPFVVSYERSRPLFMM